MDNMSKKDLPNSSDHPDTLAQPLKLKESLRIRDGLVDGAGSHEIRWPRSWGSHMVSSEWKNYWVSNN